MDGEAVGVVKSNGADGSPSGAPRASLSAGLGQGDDCRSSGLCPEPGSEAPAGSELENGNGSKARKPYTISKARERWSEEEHQRFVEAVRLHGRAWRKIEEHIGTKTAVQIRSHAQKFFNKLEKKKEAGELPDKEEDITIPPPRPKRKPSKPYPRKDGMSSSGFTGTSQLQASSQLPASSSLPAALHSALQQHLLLQQQSSHSQRASQQQQQQQHLLLQQQQQLPLSHAAQQHFAAMPLGVDGLLHSLDSLTTASSLAPQQLQHCGGEVTDATVAAVTAAASAAAAAAAAAVVAAAGQEVQTHMQAHPPSCFPFFGMPPSSFSHGAAGAPALDPAAVLAEQQAAGTAAYRVGGGGGAAAAAAVEAAAAPAVAAAAAAAGAAAAAAADEDMGDDDNARGDRGLVEATGTTDGTHISANAQLRGSDGDSACSRETDNQGPSTAMDVTWTGQLHVQVQEHQDAQHHHASNPAAVAAAAAAGSFGSFGINEMLQALGGPAQLLALLSNPYLAAASQHLSPAHLVAAAAAVPPPPTSDAMEYVLAAGARSSGGADTSSDPTTVGGSGGSGQRSGSGRTKSRRTAPSGNSGSTGRPLGAKRGLTSGSEECAPAAKKAREAASDAADVGLEASPSSPSIQAKHLTKHGQQSQPSNTNGGNTSGSNESDASKRRRGTTQGEGSNPYSVKDSNTATHTNGCSANGNGGSGNGTSAFVPLSQHHQQHANNGHSNQHASRRAKGAAADGGAAAGGAAAGHHHHHHHHHSHAKQQQHAAAGAEASNGGNGMSGTNGTNGTSGNGSGRDEGRSSSDLEGPTGQQLLHRHQREAQGAEEDTAGGQLHVQAGGQADGGQAAQLQALLASLHGMCGASPLMHMHAYGAAAAAAATAQQIMASAMHQQHQPAHADAQHQHKDAPHSQLAAVLQQLQQGGEQRAAPAAPVSQGFAPYGSAQGNGGGSLFGLTPASAAAAAREASHRHQSEAAANAQLAAAAAGLMGLGGGSWGAAAGSAAAAAAVAVGGGTGRPQAASLSMDSYARFSGGGGGIHRQARST